MRLLLKLGVVVVVLVALGIGLVPPLLAREQLATDATDAARAASNVADTQSQAAAAVAAAQAIADDPGVQLDKVSIQYGGYAPTVVVTVSETVHTFMDGIPGLRGWFHVVSTQQSQLGQ